MKVGSKAFAVVLLFAALVLVNFLASKLPVRGDATAERIYTLSPGTKTLLGKMEDTVQLDFYFSRRAEGVPITIKNYGVRVEEMLRQYVRAAGGKIQFKVIDPQPDTPEEEKASAVGLTGLRLPSGEQFYFGLVATQADQQKAISNFVQDPRNAFVREPFLEYDISQLVYSVQQYNKKKLGLITSLPLRGTPSMPMMRQPGRPSQFVLTEWEKTFEIVNVEATATELPANLDVLAVIHPQNLSPQLNYALDQFVLSGKPVFIAVDPISQYFKRQEANQMGMMNGPQPNTASDLLELFKAYGIGYDPQQVVGDLDNATNLSDGNGGVVRLPTWISFTKENFNAKSLPTAQLNSLLLVEGGFFTVKGDAGVAVTPLVESSDRTGSAHAMVLTMSPPDQIAGQISPSGKKLVAALIQGKLKSAYPKGPPTAPVPPKDNKDNADAVPGKKDAAPALAESKTSSTLILIADTDWLFDDYFLDPQYLRMRMYMPLRDNYVLAGNALEFLAGSQDLISIRGKGSSQRPFTVVRRMEAVAQQRYQKELTDLEGRLNEVQQEITKLQDQKTDGNRLIASPDVTKAIEGYNKKAADIRGQRRKIQRVLREDIEALGNNLFVINLLSGPVLVVAFGIFFFWRRKK